MVKKKFFFIKGDISEDLLAFMKDFMEVGVGWALEEEEVCLVLVSE